MKKYFATQNLRFGLFVSIIALAPLSKYPSLALPAYNFSSFRLGLYQLLAAVFVLLSVWPTLQKLRSLFKQNRLVFSSLWLLAIAAILGITTALYKSRSALLIVSILFLIGLVITAWWYVRFELPPASYKLIIKIMLWSGIVFSLIGAAEFLANTLTTNSFGILCTNCSNAVFGFPRINGFAAEPQFLANTLLPFFFIALAATYLHKSWLNVIAFILSAYVIILTFSRGAFVAVAVGVIVFAILLWQHHLLTWQKLLWPVVIIIATVLIGFGSLVASAVYRYHASPHIAFNTTVSMLDQLSLGVINIPQKPIQTTVSAKSTSQPVASFVPAGLVEASTNDRLSAAQLALKAWRSNPYTIVFGVGTGNLGPYVDKHIAAGAPNNLTVYIFYVLILAELGLIGLVAFLLLSFVSLWQFIKKLAGRQVVMSAGVAATISAFIVQQWFFGTYINTVYIWLWLGIILGMSLPLVKKDYNLKQL